MSIAVGLVGIDCIVLATDSRVIEESEACKTHHDYAKKLRELCNSVGIMRVGGNRGYSRWLIELYQEILNDIPEEEKQKISGISSVARHFSRVVKNDYSFYAKGVPPSFQNASGYVMEFVLAGYTSEGEPRLVSLSSAPKEPRFAPCIMNPYYITGITTVGEYIIGKEKKRLYKGLKMEVLKQIAVRIVLETAKHDDRVGGKIQMASITKEDGYVELNPKDLRDYGKRKTTTS